ncbi:RNA polymerase sigma factor [Sphingomonas sp. UYP23]
MTQHASTLSRASEHGDLRPLLQRFVERRLGHRADSEDIVQEIYVRLYEYRRTRSIGDVGAFCFTVARNLINDHLRRMRRVGVAEAVSEELICPAPRADEILAYRERVDVLIRALKAMPALRREVFTRRRLEEQPIATIAAALGMTNAAVERHCGRAVADLRHALARRGLALGEGA